MNIRTSITHTLNVVEKRKGYWSGASTDNIVTKYVIQVSLVTAGSGGEALEWQVARRYSHFRSNHAALSTMFAQLQLPRLPPKVISMERIGNSGSMPPDPETVASRMVLLDAYLKQMLAHPAVAGCTQMRTFLAAYQGMRPTWFADVQPATAGLASSALRYASSSTKRDATTSGSGTAAVELPLSCSMLSVFGGSFGRRICENMELSAAWLERKCE